MDALQHYSWPGNMRELENVVERAMIASNGDTLQLDDTPGFGRGWALARPAVSDNLDAVQCAHIEAVLARWVVADQRQWQRRRATGHAP